jgi:dinuclear metal center YbgI/SA1388 family protein
MLLQEFLNLLAGIAPFSLQESYDNSGIQIGSPNQQVSCGLVCLDVTTDVLKEAYENKCDLIICHHPLIFKGVSSITGKNDTELVILEAIKKGIAIVAIHTNLDKTHHGVNHELGERLGLRNMRILLPEKGLLKKLVTFCPTAQAEQVRAALFEVGAGVIGNYDCCSFNSEGKGSFRAGENTNPFTGSLNELHYEPEVRVETIFPAYLQSDILQALHQSHPYEEVAYDVYPLDNAFERVGSGMIGDLIEPMPADHFLTHIKKSLNIPVLRHSAIVHEQIKNVAICGGSGSFLLHNAIKSGAQAFVTADIKYHQFFDAVNRLMLVDAGHYETEQYTKNLLHKMVKKKMPKFALLISETNTNPVNYY